MNENLKMLLEMQEADLKEMVKEHQVIEQESNFSLSKNQKDIIKYSTLELDNIKTLKFYRVLGWPIHLRHKDPQYSPKLVMISRIVDDRGSYRRFILPSRKEDKNFILYKLIDKVLEGVYDQVTNTKTYYHATAHPEIFNAVFKNSVVNSTYENGWKPTQFIIMNVIDRAMIDWHRENKHSVLVSKKATTDKTKPDVIYYQDGTTMAMYNAIMADELAGAFGFPIKYDVVIKKLDKDPWYKAFHPSQFKSFAGSKYSSEEEFKKDYPFYNPEMHIQPVTEEELSWERYDIEDRFKVSSYYKIDKYLKDWFKKFDATFHLHLTEELKDLVAEEKIRNKEIYENKDNFAITTTHPTSSKEKLASTIQAELPIDRNEVKPQNRPSGFNFDDLKEKGFQAIDSLTEEEIAMITGYDEVKKTLTYKDDGPIYTCKNAPECTNLTPEMFHVCPKCGILF